MSEQPFAAIVIGASAGALEALSKILPALPVDFPLAIIIVVHIPADKQSVLAEIFAGKCKLTVKEAEDKEPVTPGTVYFAPPDYHVLVEADRRLSLSNDEPVLYSRPSIDVLFETAADAYGDELIGIILTGANNDGAQGLKTVMDAGGTGYIQTPKMAYASAMPQAAIAACPEAYVYSLDEIVQHLQQLAVDA